MAVLLDSVIVIDHLNGVAAATAYLRNCGPSAACSAITWGEVLACCRPESTASVEALLSAFAFLPMDRAVAVAAASLRRDHRWRLPDAIQAAMALQHGLQLATRNTRDFPPDRFDFVVVPYGWPG